MLQNLGEAQLGVECHLPVPLAFVLLVLHYFSRKYVAECGEVLDKI